MEQRPTKRADVSWRRIGVATGVIVVVLIILSTWRVGAAAAMGWVTTLGLIAAAGGVCVCWWLFVRGRGRGRAELLRGRFPNSIIVAAAPVLNTGRETRKIARLLGVSAHSLWFCLTVSLVADADALRVYSGSSSPREVLVVPSGAIDRVARGASAPGTNGMPIPGIEFAIKHNGERLPLNFSMPTSRIRDAVERIRTALL